MNEPSQTINRNFPIWKQQQPRQHPPTLHPSSDKPIPFQTTRIPIPNRMNWNHNKAAKKRKRASTAGELAGYQTPSLSDLQFQNRLIARRLYPKKNNPGNNRFAPYAPRNTTSFLIRAKKSGGIASLPSTSPVTPAILPTPKFSPSKEGLVDMAKEQWGVDGYGSMKGLIRLRSGQNLENEEEDDEDGSSDSEVEEHLEVDKRMDHDLSRFEMVYPSFGEDQGAAAAYVLESRVDDQETRIAKLEEENLTLKERLFLMEREMREMSERLDRLENNNNCNKDDDVGVINNDDEEEEHSYSSNVNLNGNELCDNVGVCLEEKSGDCDGGEINENLIGME